MLRALAVMGVALAAGLAGCTNAQLSSAIVRPEKYAYYTCEQMASAGMVEARRERELKDLIDKAGQGAGGEFAAAVAYRGEYLLAQGNLRELEAAAVHKNCAMPWRTISERALQ